MSLQALKDTIKSYYPVEPNWDLLEKAYWFAVKAHQGQKRFSGELYITHPLGVANILAELELDLILKRRSLHDVWKIPRLLKKLKLNWCRLAQLVDGVTKL